MKLFKVDRFVYTKSNSLLPPNPQPPDEVPPYEDAAFLPVGQAFIQALINAGYTQAQAERLWYETFAWYWNVCGIKDIFHCGRECTAWLHRFLNPVIAKVDGPQPFGIPPQVIFFAAIMTIVIVAFVLVAPEWEEQTVWAPPCNLYMGVYRSRFVWMTLAGVSMRQVPYYQGLVAEDALIQAHTYEYIAPPVVTDRLHFWGGLEWKCWQIPWFRVYRTQYVDTTFVGYLTHTSAGIYYLREGFRDRWAPRGPMTVDPARYCTQFSPCSP